MSETERAPHEQEQGDAAPGDEHAGQESVARGVTGYLIGLGLATLLTIASFVVAESGIVWLPAVPVALVTLAVAQMGIHLVFFLHMTSGPDNTNNALALAFGVLICFLVMAGTIWIMWHLNHNMMPMDKLMEMQH